MVALAIHHSPSLLRRIREAVGGFALTPRAKIDHILHIISSELAVDMCAVYVLRGGAALELLAAHGISLQRPQRLRLKVGHGVISDVIGNARPLVLSDIKTHPRFYFDPEVGEEQATSFLGVPLFHGGKVVGALVVQNQKKRLFSHEEVDNVQNVAMVITEIMVAGHFLSSDAFLLPETTDPIRSKLKGSCIHAGYAIGYAVPHHTLFPVKKLISDNTERELHRLYEAVGYMHQSLKSLVTQSTVYQDKQTREILETYQLFAQDRGWLNRIQKAVENGLTAEAAVKKARADLRLRISRSNDPYFRERLWDFEDLTNRLLKTLEGRESQFECLSTKGIILVAHRMGPAELLEYEKYKLKGLILEEDLHAAHVSIIARALDIPVISNVPSALHVIEFGDLIVMDAEQGDVYIQPHDDVLCVYEQKQLKQHHYDVQLSRLHHRPTETKDGIKISLYMNAGSVTEVRRLHQENVNGIGLYRTEIPFMVQSGYPDGLTQERLYKEVILAAGQYPIVFRTLDTGGDKKLPYMPFLPEENPSLGWRAIRMGLDIPHMLRTQVRALMRASAGRELHLLFPMVTTTAEFLQAKKLVEFEKKILSERQSALPSRILYGAMLEVPAIVWMLDDLLPQVDFVSVGSNDLAQFFFAVDRASPLLSGRYDRLSAPFLNLLQYIVEKANQFQKPLSLCGEMASHPLEAAVLLALGFRQLSMPASAIGPIKMMIHHLHLAHLKTYIDYLCARNEQHLRQKLHFFAYDHGFIKEQKSDFK